MLEIRLEINKHKETMQLVKFRVMYPIVMEPIRWKIPLCSRGQDKNLFLALV